MKDREIACWFVGGLLAAFGALCFLTGVIGHYKVKVTTIQAKAWVQIAHDVKMGIVSLTD